MKRGHPRSGVEWPVDRIVAAYRDGGSTADELAAAYGISERQLYRILKAGGAPPRVRRLTPEVKRAMVQAYTAAPTTITAVARQFDVSRAAMSHVLHAAGVRVLTFREAMKLRGKRKNGSWTIR